MAVGLDFAQINLELKIGKFHVSYRLHPDILVMSYAMTEMTSLNRMLLSKARGET